ncbi:MAG: hypothetical protein JJT78_10170 [Leptospira sp.]|nr:hypothetical protein [Leptospira sp.]
MIYLAVLFALPLVACSSLFWRSASLPPETLISGNSQLIYQVVYLERDSWNPMMGTTIKKSYQTRVTLQDKKDSQAIKELPNINSWILPGKMTYVSETDSLFWIQGIDDEYGTLQRKAGIAQNIRTKGFSETKFWEGEKELIHLTPSPNGDKVAFVFTRSNSSGMPETFLTVWNHKTEEKPTQNHKLPTWDESDGSPNPNYDLIWRSNDSLNVKLDKKSLTWTASGLK